MTVEQCTQANAVLFRRTPDFDKELKRDRFPWSIVYSNMYKQEQWPIGRGTVHYRDRVHTTRPNDDGCWEAVTMGGDGNMTGCDSNCSTPRQVIGWGSTRYNYTRFKRDYTTPPLCYDQMSDVEEVIAQLDAILDGLKKEPDSIVSDFLRLLSLRQSNKIYIAGAARTELDVSAGMFQNNCKNIDLGGAGNLPTSKLTMQYLMSYIEQLQYNGYWNKEFMPQGTIACTTDIQTHLNLGIQNPTLVQMYCLPDFGRGGKFFDYGMMQKQIGPFMFKLDPEPMRFQHIGGGVLQRVWPYENVVATVGKKPEFSAAYSNAAYQLYHVYNRDARTVFVRDIAPINPELKFNMSRDMLGKWRWMSPDFFTYTDPNTGVECNFQNDKHNRGYLLGEYNIGAVTDYAEIEMMIIAERELQGVTNDPRCAPQAAMVYQELAPYNEWCNEPA